MNPTFLLDGFALKEPLAGDGGAAKWQQLFPIGVTKHRGDFPDGKIEFSQQMLSTMAQNAKGIIAKGHQIQVNYHHLGGSDVSASSPLESTVAAGWMKDVEVRADGLWALMSWTERARKFIADDELKYLSPEFTLDYANRDTGKKQGPTLLGAALTNTPFLKELPRVAATDASPKKADPSAEVKESRMDKKQVCAALGLAEDTAEDAVIAKMKELQAAALKLAEQTTKLTEFEGSSIKLVGEVNTLRKENEEFKLSARKSSVVSFCDKLQAAGQISPAIREDVERIGMLGGVDAIKFYEKVPKNSAVDLTERGVRGDDNASVDAKRTAAQKRLNDRVSELRKEDPKLAFRDAYSMAQREMPEAQELLYGASAKQ